MKYLSKEELKKYKRFLKKKESNDDDDDDDVGAEPNTIYEFEKDIYEIKNIFEKVQNIFNNFKIDNMEVYYENIAKKEGNSFTFVKSEVENKEGKLKTKKYSGTMLKKYEMDYSGSFSLNILKGSLSVSPIKICFVLFKYSHIFAYQIKLLSFLDLVIAVVPSIDIQACIDIGISANLAKKEGKFFIDASGEASCSLTLDLGFYVPSNRSIISISFNIGIHGIIGAGKVGIKLELDFKDNFNVQIYVEIKAFEFSFYIMLMFTFSILAYTFSFKIYILNEVFAQLVKYTYLYKKVYSYKDGKLNKTLSKTKSDFRMQFINLKYNKTNIASLS